MVTISLPDCNTISQNYYDQLIASIDLVNIICPVCGHGACMSVHGYYTRHIKESSGGKSPIRIMRTKCSFCKHTHAILPSAIVPYSQIILPDQNRILDLYEEGASACETADAIPSADENNVKSIVLRYVRHWRQRLLARDIGRHPIGEMVRSCFSFYARQFLQIRHTPNILFFKPT